MKRVVFVDDEQLMLDGLQRMLRPKRREWEMRFFDDGRKALAAIDSEPCDVIVSDMRMPGMDGVTLLREVLNKHPDVIRIALSGQADLHVIYSCVRYAHQYLSKPCPPDDLIATIDSAFALQSIVSDSDLRALIAGLESIPALPEAYNQILDELRSEEPSIDEIGRIVERDVAMTAKILQIVNSSYFGLPRHVSSPTEAAMYIGVDTIKNLVVSTGVFGQFDDDVVAAMGLRELSQRSMAVGKLAQDIATEETDSDLIADYSLMAGLLLDIGKLVLATGRSDIAVAAYDAAAVADMDECAAERHAFGFSHPEIGAYITALWGLPNSIVEAVAYHHNPDASPSNTFSALTAVHVADALIPSVGSADAGDIDKTYIERLGMRDNWEQWVSIAEQQ